MQATELPVSRGAIHWSDFKTEIFPDFARGVVERRSAAIERQINNPPGSLPVYEAIHISQIAPAVGGGNGRDADHAIAGLGALGRDSVESLLRLRGEIRPAGQLRETRRSRIRQQTPSQTRIAHEHDLVSYRRHEHCGVIIRRFVEQQHPALSALEISRTNASLVNSVR